MELKSTIGGMAPGECAPACRCCRACEQFRRRHPSHFKPNPGIDVDKRPDTSAEIWAERSKWT